MSLWFIWDHTSLLYRNLEMLRQVNEWYQINPEPFSILYLIIKQIGCHENIFDIVPLWALGRLMFEGP